MNKTKPSKSIKKKSFPLVAVLMGSQSDWKTMQAATRILEELRIPHEARIVSAHRTPDRMVAFAKGAKKEGFQVIIAGAGGAAHLPGMLASLTTLPVLGVPIDATEFDGLDSMLSMAQMPGGVPVGTLAIGEPGAKNAGLLAARILALSDPAVNAALSAWHARQTAAVAHKPS